MLCQVKCLKRKACDAGVDIASRGREGALTVIREGVWGPSVVQTRLGNAGRAEWRDGWVRKRRRRRQGGWLHKLSVIHTRTHFISPMVSWLPRPLLFLDLRSHCTCLELSIYIGMGISRFPPPTSSRTVKHTHSASNSLTLTIHVAAYHSWLQTHPIAAW